MRYIVFMFFLLSCSTRINHNKSLYTAEVEIVKVNGIKDTLSVVYFDYIYLDVKDHKLYKKNGALIQSEVKKYKIIYKTKTKI